MRKFSRGFGPAVLLMALVGLSVWAWLGGAKADSQNAGQLLSPVQAIYDRIKSDFYKPGKAGDKELLNGAIRGMIQQLDDPYTSYLPADEYKKFTESFGKDVIRDETYGGIGTQIEVADGRLIVVSPLQGSPALRAGVRANDWIKSIDGRSTLGITVEEASRKLRGEKGTPVTISVQHEDGTEQAITIVREIIHYQLRVVTHERMDNGQIGYIQVNQFNENVGEEVGKALDDFLKPGNTVKAFILDLRYDPGGYLNSAIDLASLFIDNGVILRTESREGTQTFTSHGNRVPNLPLAILINRGSASASEITAGAIRDHQMGILVGRTSFGKGVVQTIFDLPDGSKLKLTTAEYFTPNNHRVQGVGLTPDIWVEHEEDTLKVATEWLRSQYGKTCPCQAPRHEEAHASAYPPSFYSWFRP